MIFKNKKINKRRFLNRSSYVHAIDFHTNKIVCFPLKKKYIQLQVNVVKKI